MYRPTGTISSQPMVFRGWRDTISAATIANTTGATNEIDASLARWSAFLEPPCLSRPTPDQMIERQITSPYKDQANQAAVRRLNLPTPRRSCPLDPSVTTPLYSTAVS